MHASAVVRFSFAYAAFVLASAVPLLLVCEQAAQADALPPPVAMKCKEGTTFVHDHNGSNCVANAPTDCPVGWMGIRGGKCMLQVCETSGSCPAGLECKAANLCSSERMGASYGSMKSARSPVLAAPPMARWMIAYSDVCSAASTCNGSEKCVGSSVCLPPEVQAPAGKPANAMNAEIPGERGAPRRPPAKTALPSATGFASATPAAANNVPPPSVPPTGRGGAGCATSPVGQGTLSLTIGGIALALAVRSRRNVGSGERSRAASK
jgi:hypothetical protein